MDEIKRMQHLAEIKVNNPNQIKKVSLNVIKQALINNERVTAEDLEFEKYRTIYSRFYTKNK